MKIDLSLLEDIGNKKEIVSQINFQNLKFRNQDIQIPEPLNLKLDIYKTDAAFVFTGSLKGHLVLECSRCLQKFEYDFEFEINQEISENEIEDINKFDLNNMLIKDIFLTIPIKPLCSEDCKGLCPKCGQDLNQGECDCETESIDPRLADLKNFYENEEK